MYTLYLSGCFLGGWVDLPHESGSSAGDVAAQLILLSDWVPNHSWLDTTKQRHHSNLIHLHIRYTHMYMYQHGTVLLQYMHIILYVYIHVLHVQCHTYTCIRAAPGLPIHLIKGKWSTCTYDISFFGNHIHVHTSIYTYVAVPCRKRTLFRF